MCAHALTDFQLQSPIMWKQKRYGSADWCYWLTAHALICGGGVYVVTSSLGLAVVETIAHWVIDYCKSVNKIGWHRDQILHILCRIGYVL